MEVCSVYKYYRRQPKVSLGKENKSPSAVLYCPAKMKNKRKFIALESSKGLQSYAREQPEQSSKDSYAIFVDKRSHTSMGLICSDHRSFMGNSLLSILTSNPGITQKILSFLDVVSITRLSLSSRECRDQNMVQEQIYRRVSREKLKDEETQFLCRRWCETALKSRFGQLMAVPCKLSEQIAADIKRFAVEPEKAKQILQIAKEIKLSYPQMEYQRSFLSLVRKLLSYFSPSTTYAILSSLILKRGLYRLYDTYEHKEPLSGILLRMVNQHTSHLPNNHKERTVEKIIVRFLRPFFSEEIFSNKQWLHFLALFVLQGWRVVTILLTQLIQTNFQSFESDECLEGSGLPTLIERLRRSPMREQPMSSSEQEFISFFHEQAPTRGRDIKIQLGGKKTHRTVGSARVK